MSSDHQQLLQITEHDRFYARLLTKESSPGDHSFRVYYCGAAGAVPFLWESRLGTPKKTDAAATNIPPIPPPPSRHFNPNNNGNARRQQPTRSFVRSTLSRLRRSTRSSAVDVPVSPRSSTSSSGWRYSSPRSSFSSRDEASVHSSEWAPSTSFPLRGTGRRPLNLRNVLLSMICRSRESTPDAS